MSALFRTWPERAPAAVDIGLLPIRDRACLRLLDRYESATAEQLAILVHPTVRTSQRRLRRLSRLGAVDPRVASAAHLRHSLDIIWVTASRSSDHPNRSHPGAVVPSGLDRR